MACGAVEMCFGASWLDTTAENDSKGRTNREVQVAVSIMTKQDRFTLIIPQLFKERSALTRTPKPMGAISQMWAGFTHHVRAERLAQSGDPD